MTSDDWPWDYMYVAARSELRISDEEYWSMLPVVLFSYLREHREILLYKVKLLSYGIRGGDLDALYRPTTPAPYVHPDAF